MDQIVQFYAEHGGWITLIAIAGIVLLGILKYCGVFKKLDVDTRHYAYIGISAGLTVIGSLIYLGAEGTLNIKEFSSLTTSVYALNQMFYNIFKVTPVNRLFVNLLNLIFGNEIEEYNEAEEILKCQEEEYNELKDKKNK